MQRHYGVRAHALRFCAIAAGPAKKPYEITYKTKSVAQLQAEQKGKVEQVAGLLDCDVSGSSSRARDVG